MPLDRHFVNQNKINMISLTHTVTAASTQDFGIYTGTKDTHAFIRVLANDATQVKVYEAPTNAAFGGGTTVTSVQLNRVATDAHLSLTGCRTPTWKTATSKTPIYNGLIPGGDVTVVYPSGSPDMQLVLTASTFYIFQVKNISGGTVGAALTVHFYEMDV